MKAKNLKAIAALESFFVHTGADDISNALNSILSDYAAIKGCTPDDLAETFDNFAILRALLNALNNCSAYDIKVKTKNGVLVATLPDNTNLEANALEEIAEFMERTAKGVNAEKTYFDYKDNGGEIIGRLKWTRNK